MSKYAIARKAIEDAMAAAKADGNVSAEDILETLIVCTAEAIEKESGKAKAAAILDYELKAYGGGGVDTNYIRSR